MTEPKDKRISVEIKDAELAEEIEVLAEKLHVAKGTIGFFALRYVMPRVKSGELAVVNGELIENPAAAA